MHSQGRPKFVVTSRPVSTGQSRQASRTRLECTTGLLRLACSILARRCNHMRAATGLASPSRRGWDHLGESGSDTPCGQWRTSLTVGIDLASQGVKLDATTGFRRQDGSVEEVRHGKPQGGPVEDVCRGRRQDRPVGDVRRDRRQGRPVGDRAGQSRGFVAVDHRAGQSRMRVAGGDRVGQSRTCVAVGDRTGQPESRGFDVVPADKACCGRRQDGPIGELDEDSDRTGQLRTHVAVDHRAGQSVRLFAVSGSRTGQPMTRVAIDDATS